jgi:hypothetical protein
VDLHVLVVVHRVHEHLIAISKLLLLQNLSRTSLSFRASRKLGNFGQVFSLSRLALQV